MTFQNPKSPQLVHDATPACCEIVRVRDGDPKDCLARLSRRRASNDRSGFTLLEIMLVMAIMVVVAALATPAFQRVISEQALVKGADRLRVAMGQARVKAIRNGQEYAVFVSPGGSYFSVAPFTQYEKEVSAAARRDQVAQRRGQTNLEEDLLPKGVTFLGSEVGSDARSMAVMAENGAASSIRPILFYPDGTSQDAVVILQNDKQSQVEVQLRGLSGMARTVPRRSGQ